MLDIVEKKFIKFIKTHHAGQTVKKKVPLNKKKNTTLFVQLAKQAGNGSRAPSTGGSKTGLKGKALGSGRKRRWL